MFDIHKALGELAGFALHAGLLEEADVVYSVNQAADILGLEAFQGEIDRNTKLDSPAGLLEEILDWAFENGCFESNGPVYRDLFDARLMNAFTPRPSEVARKFWTLYDRDKVEATDWYYGISQSTNYIRTDRVSKNMVWKSETVYGDLDITVNLSKPEKDPKAIAAAKHMKSSGYPKCLLCKENEGYAGRLNHPGRSNHRIIPIELGAEAWFLQYSPYVYYNEHCIVLKGAHVPMKIGFDTFVRLLDFVQVFPHYFVGSNADLPIVGGSILSHDHFQGGRYTFAMEKAPVRQQIALSAYPEVEAGIVKWPMSVIRLRHSEKSVLVKAADHVFEAWKAYSDPEAEVLAYTGDERHNTVTPIARFAEGAYEMDIVLRNNRTSDEHPLGIFHPHSDVHHIKKENIGLIEVMGLAVLPARLKDELEALSAEWMGSETDLDTNIHEAWLSSLKAQYSPQSQADALEILKHETGKKFMRVLQDAGVFKDTESGKEAFGRFTSLL